MSDTNGGTDFPMTGDPRADAALTRLREHLDKHDALLEGINDALIVNAHLEKRQSELLVQHAEFIAFHDLKMREIDEKLNALIDIVMRREGGSEARP
ncbi:MAG: hypothetical protein JOZ48_01190 [Acidobacteriaceae bacterium]|nr:hypothetical protein [Acidobacteriaceae bacterium]